MSEPDSTEQWSIARRLIEEYAASLQVDLCFQNFEDEIANLPREYGPPGGAFLLAALGDDWVGCVALRKLAEPDCEMKRLYVDPRGRGHRVGRSLVEGIVARARQLG